LLHPYPKNNLSHPSHPSQLSRLDVLWSILGRELATNLPLAPSIQGRGARSKKSQVVSGE